MFGAQQYFSNRTGFRVAPAGSSISLATKSTFRATFAARKVILICRVFLMNSRGSLIRGVHRAGSKKSLGVRRK